MADSRESASADARAGQPRPMASPPAALINDRLVGESGTGRVGETCFERVGSIAESGVVIVFMATALEPARVWGENGAHAPSR